MAEKGRTRSNDRPDMPKGADADLCVLSPNQKSPKDAKPEDFTVNQWSAGVSVSGQRADNSEAARKSNTKYNRGSNYKDAIRVDQYGEPAIDSKTASKAKSEAEI
jgi:hypothetical protein